MTYMSAFKELSRPALAAIALSLAALGCGGDQVADGGDDILDRPIPGGCVVVLHDGEPDLVNGPGIVPSSAGPGSTVEFSVQVDDETQSVTATLMDAWRTRNPPGQPPSEPVTVTRVDGNTLEFAIPTTTDMRARYYADLVLCAGNCEQSRVVYTLNPANREDPINDPYHRIVVEGDDEVSSAATCIFPDSIALQ
jgi:hypothetical protein